MTGKRSNKRRRRPVATSWKLADELLGLWPGTRDAMREEWPDDKEIEKSIQEASEAFYTVHRTLRNAMHEMMGGERVVNRTDMAQSANPIEFDGVGMRDHDSAACEGARQGR